MIIKAKKNRELALINAQNTQNENRAETITLVVPEEYEDYNKKIVFILPNNTRVSDIITNNEYQITNAITQYEEVEFYIWLTKGNVDFRTKTKPLKFYHNENASNDITPEQIGLVNTVVNLLEEEIDKVENLDLDVEKIGTVATLTLTKKDGTTKEVEITDGTDGQDGYTPQKGVDYFTQEDIQEIENGVKTDLQETVLIDYSLITETGSKIDLSVNTTNYKLTAILKDKNNNIICTSNEIDLPLETMVISASYDNTTKEIILTLQNGTTVEFSVADLVSGLVSESQLQTILANYYTQTEINNLLANKVDKVQGKGLSTEDYTTTEKTKLSGIEAEANKTIVDDELDNESENPVQNKVINTEIGNLQAENERLRNTLPTTTGTGQTITLNKTAELEFKKPPLPMGNSEQVQYSGKNLAGPIQGNITSAGITIQATDNSISINGTATDDSTFQLVGETITRPSKYFQGLVLNEQNSIKISAGTYILSSNETGLLKFYGNLGDNLGNCTSITSGTAFTITEDKYVWLGIYIGSGVAINKTIDNLQLEQGSTATSFEPYTGGTASPNPDYPQEITNVTGDVEVVVENKNLAWNGWAEDFVRRIDNTLLANIETKDNRNCLKQGASAGWKDYDNKYIFKTNFKENTQYTLIFDLLAERSTQGNIGIEHTDGTIVEPSNLTLNVWNKVVLTSSPNKTIKYIRGVYRDGAEWIDLDTFMVYEGTEQIDFIPHKEQKFIFPLGNEKLMLGDYLANDGIHHVRGQVTLDGSENWQDYKSSDITNYYIQSNILNNIKNNINVLNNSFQKDTYASYQANKLYVFSSLNGGFSIFVDNTEERFSTTLKFKEWLSAHNLVLEYELEEEQIVPYTSAQQTVYNAIKQALSYEGQTNISSNQNAIFNVEAYLDTKVILSEKGTYNKPSTGIPKTDLSNAVQTSLNKADTALQSHQDISGKQDITDNTLTTINKTVPTAINEVNSIAKGANQAVSYSNYQAMITAFNALANDVYNVGQNVMIVTLEVPDLWISGIESTSQSYTYTTDEAFTTELATNGYVQVGYYKLSALETQKVDLTDYEQNTNKTTTISSSSTNAQYPSAKAVYDYIQSLDGDEVSY